MKKFVITRSYGKNGSGKSLPEPSEAFLQTAMGKQVIGTPPPYI
jgi:hypothetical protein